MKLKIAELRKLKGITQNQLAHSVGVTFQTVSKWENEVSLPDITLLPDLAAYFNVSVDELLGLKPLRHSVYESRKSHMSDYWDHQLQYLKDTRAFLWNDDYLEFLVKKVWKIETPVDVVDFGCGYGYLGMKFMPLLPEGSTYTGIDVNENLLQEGRRLFKDSGFQTTFLCQDMNDYSAKATFDLVLCQAFLRHMPTPEAFLEKMVHSARDKGLVVCIEGSRSIENSGLCIEGLNFAEFESTSMMQKLWKKELETEGRDYNFAMKIPMLMNKMGLTSVAVRMGDKVNVIRNTAEEEASFNALTRAQGWDRPKSDDEREKTANLFMNRGLSRAEAEQYIRSNEGIVRHIQQTEMPLAIVKFYGLMISYGWKALSSID